MSSSRKKPPARPAKKTVATGSTTKVRKRARNLSLSAEAIARGEAYSRQHGTNLSKLVGDFLRALPLSVGAVREVSPAVRRLYGVAEGGHASVEEYLEHLNDKYSHD